MKRRLILDLLLFLGVFVAPLWLLAIVAVIFLFVFEDFYEIIFLGIIADGLYGLSSGLIGPVTYTLFASIFFLARSSLRRHLKFYI